MPVLVVGAGFSGATLARECAEAGLKVIVIEARSLARSAVAALRMGQRPPSLRLRLKLASLPNPS